MLTRWYSVGLAIGLWWLISLLLPGNLFPNPWDTAVTLVDNIKDGAIWADLAITLVRVIGGLALGALIGMPVGVWMGLSRRVENWLDAWIMIGMSIPSLCYALVCFIVLGLNEFATIVAIGLTAAPSIAINLWEGVKNIDMRLVSMARVFDASSWQVMRRVIAPQVMPYVMASVRFGLGVVWKITVFIELIGRPNGVGFKLYYWYQLADMRQVLAWTVVFTIVMLGIELLIFKPVERRLFSWRPGVQL